MICLIEGKLLFILKISIISGSKLYRQKSKVQNIFIINGHLVGTDLIVSGLCTK
jgi:hypothetical protein